MGVHDIAIDDAYEKWSDELVAYATALSGPDHADDIVADAFVTLIRRERHDAASGHPSRWSAVADPRPYLFRTVFNSAAAQFRATGRRRARESRSRQDPHNRRWVPPADTLLADPVVLAAVNSLSRQQRGAVYLTYWLDFPAHEVGDVLGCSAGSVKRHLARARATLRTAFDRKDAR